MREFVFPPAGGTKNTRMVASILTGRDEALPFMILDGDTMGRKLAKELGTSLYQEHADRLISVDDHTGMEGSEIEDLIPTDVMAAVIDRMYRNADTEFADTLVTGKPILGQIEAWAAAQRVDLEPGWKVELSKRVKQHLLTKGMAIVKQEYGERWQRLFDTLGSTSAPA